MVIVAVGRIFRVIGRMILVRLVSSVTASIVALPPWYLAQHRALIHVIIVVNRATINGIVLNSAMIKLPVECKEVHVAMDVMVTEVVVVEDPIREHVGR